MANYFLSKMLDRLDDLKGVSKLLLNNSAQDYVQGECLWKPGWATDWGVRLAEQGQGADSWLPWPCVWSLEFTRGDGEEQRRDGAAGTGTNKWQKDKLKRADWGHYQAYHGEPRPLEYNSRWTNLNERRHHRILKDPQGWTRDTCEVDCESVLSY